MNTKDKEIEILKGIMNLQTEVLNEIDNASKLNDNEFREELKRIKKEYSPKVSASFCALTAHYLLEDITGQDESEG